MTKPLIGAIVTNPRVMRQMPRLLRAAGFELVTVFSHVLPEMGHGELLGRRHRDAIES